MNRILLLAAAVLLLAGTGCKTAEKEEVVVVPTTLFKAMIVRFPVSDYNNWKMNFIEDDSMRTANNVHNIGYARGIDDTNMVVVINEFTDVTKAKGFMSSPELKMAMDSGAVTGSPTIEYVNVVRNDSSVTDVKDRLMVKHAVKDFSAWLKAYDGEGMDIRKSNGLVDRAINRGMEDTNMVYVIFAVTDMQKAMARGKSEELKKIMQDAGVVSEPEFFAYRYDYLKE